MASSAEKTLNQSAALAPRSARPIAGSDPLAWLHPDLESRSIVDFSPPEIVRRHSAARSGLHVETVRVMRHTPFEYGFRAPCHLLVVPELGERYDGETFVEGLPRSTLRQFTRKLIFVPAGHDFRGWQKPRALPRTTYFYIDPCGPLADPALRFGEIEFKPRLFFYDHDLWETALKLKSLVENRARCTGNTPMRLASC
jgi:AraC family transcriptional regulator